MPDPYKTVTISMPTAPRIEKVLNEMAAEGYALHSQPMPLTGGKHATAAVVAIFVRRTA